LERGHPARFARGTGILPVFRGTGILPVFRGTGILPALLVARASLRVFEKS